jgi:hypothetical protein
MIGDDVGGIAVHIGARVAALAEPGEVLVSSTVKDLVAGSGLSFTERGTHPLKGVPGEWRLYGVERGLSPISQDWEIGDSPLFYNVQKHPQERIADLIGEDDGSPRRRRRVVIGGALAVSSCLGCGGRSRATAMTKSRT